MSDSHRARKNELVASIERARVSARSLNADMVQYLLELALQEAHDIDVSASGRLNAAVAERSRVTTADDALEAFAAEHRLSREDATARLVAEALIASGYLVHFDLDEAGESAGEA